ncbi:hypothetical protein BN59_03637 [Legionella massiliensis]|uniref:Uncharacterized protein n=1 Tax=Legionella massiliensis TaxID=1034943 RepID=A0A078L5F4_9GAMM|nr:hypothetical protein [Legionella massiliensis]CDZ79319.1 hypothetical protein BN59_03637 [Legionella massiliensis]CEE15057.1 hypothetical protein BN1094_03637 [Legionella massiliensis]
MTTIALLDVDNTLLFNGNDLNYALLNSLLEKGVKDVYLFTNMGLEDINTCGQELFPMSRHAIIQEMQRLGFNVQGVITQADAGNYDNQQQLQPVGTLFKQLYTPLMQKVLKEPLDLQTFNSDPETICDYYLNLLAFTRAENIMKARLDTPSGQTRNISLPQLTLLDTLTQKEVVANRGMLMEALKQGLIPKPYRICLSPEGGETLTVRGSDFPAGTANKALIMEAFLQQFAASDPNLSILYFDDSPEQLEACQLAVANYNKTHSNPVHLSTQQVSRNYGVANSDHLNYTKAIKEAQAPKIINQALKDVAHRYTGALYDQAGAAKFIRSHLDTMNYQQYIELAKVALTGNRVMFNPAGAHSAFYCLRIAMILAENDEQEQQVINSCRQIMGHYSYNQLKIQDVDDNLKQTYSTLMEKTATDDKEKIAKITTRFEDLKENLGKTAPSSQFSSVLGIFAPKSRTSDHAPQSLHNGLNK